VIPFGTPVLDVPPPPPTAMIGNSVDVEVEQQKIGYVNVVKSNTSKFNFFDSSLLTIFSSSTFSSSTLVDEITLAVSSLLLSFFFFFVM